MRAVSDKPEAVGNDRRQVGVCRRLLATIGDKSEFVGDCWLRSATSQSLSAMIGNKSALLFKSALLGFQMILQTLSLFLSSRGWLVWSTFLPKIVGVVLIAVLVCIT